jgi:selenide,water dikinase
LNLKSVPLMGAAYELAEQGCIPGAAFSNLEYAEPDTSFSDDLEYNLEMIAFDAQTSGGLLISIRAEKAEELLTELKSAGLIRSSIIGTVIGRKEKLLYLTN